MWARPSSARPTPPGRSAGKAASLPQLSCGRGGGPDNALHGDVHTQPVQRDAHPGPRGAPPAALGSWLRFGRGADAVAWRRRDRGRPAAPRSPSRPASMDLDGSSCVARGPTDGSRARRLCPFGSGRLLRDDRRPRAGALAGLGVGFRLRSLRVGPLLFSGPFHLSFYRGPGAAINGVAELMPVATDALVRRGVAIALVPRQPAAGRGPAIATKVAIRPSTVAEPRPPFQPSQPPPFPSRPALDTRSGRRPY